MVNQTFLRFNHISYRNHRKIQIVQFAGSRIHRTRSGGTGTAADNIGADNKIFVGIDRFTGADHLIPPARFFIFRGVAAADVSVSGQGMRYQHRVGTVGIERTGGFVADVDIFEFSAAIQRKRRLQFVIPGRCNKDPVGIQFSFDFITSSLIYHNLKYNIAHKNSFSRGIFSKNFDKNVA